MDYSSSDSESDSDSDMLDLLQDYVLLQTIMPPDDEPSAQAAPQLCKKRARPERPPPVMYVPVDYYRVPKLPDQLKGGRVAPGQLGPGPARGRKHVAIFCGCIFTAGYMLGYSGLTIFNVGERVRYVNERRVEVCGSYQRRVEEVKEKVKVANDTRLEMSERLNKRVGELVSWMNRPTSKGEGWRHALSGFLLAFKSDSTSLLSIAWTR